MFENSRGMKRKTGLTTAILLFALISQAQTRPAPKTLSARRTTEQIKIDGLLDDAAWKNAPAAVDYTEFRPTPFKKEDPANRTEVYLLYSDEGIYLGGYCYERSRDSISSELIGRDGFGNNDYVGFIFDTYYDKINAFEYFITPLGQQMDAKMSPNSNGPEEDFSWNAVWRSAAKIHNDGWSFEAFIPFSAIRFSKKSVQDWGMNITRRRQKTGQQVTWNPIDVNVNGFLTQEGVWSGLENIRPPLRLQFSPYFSTYANHYQGKWSSSLNGGMDVKYGLSQAITLDMTLIPDFGQVQSDNQVLNLTPFEVKFNENRSFFTEGTELFNKGNYFYSRRIGGRPLHYYRVQSWLNPNERIVKNPSETKLINATKVSGRLQSGLGIGFFNAVTAAQHAVIEDDAKNRREVETNPLTNFNIIVLDQSLKHNSSVSLVNTNVWRNGSDYDANVTAGLFNLYDKKNMWNFGGKLASSNKFNYLPGGGTETGYSHNFYFSKASGRFNFSLGEELVNNKFNSNDLGYFTFNNTFDHYLWMGYRWTKPGNWYNSIYLNLNLNYSRQLTPGIFRSANFNANANGQLKNLWYAGVLVGYEPEFNDFFESRTGKVFRGWSNVFADFWIETNRSKKYSFFTHFMYVDRSLFDSRRYSWGFSHRFRFSDRFSVNHSLNLEPQKRNVGFADHYESNGSPTYSFGRRDISTVSNTVGMKYSFSGKMHLNARLRHYWSEVHYDQLFDLLDDGSLRPNTFDPQAANQNYNVFTLDATFTWEFAPGSFINLVWKQFVDDYNRMVSDSYFQNFSKTMRTDVQNSLSFKIIYFLDYLQLKKKKPKS